MQNRDPMDDAARHAGAAREELNRARGDAADAAEHAGDALRHGGEALQAGASGVLERSDTVVDRARHAAGHALHDAAGTVRHAASDAADAAAEAAARAANRISDEASALRAAAGEKLDGVRGPLVGSALGALVGVLAGALGGWWAGRAMASSGHDLPEEHEEACRVHFVSYTLRPAEMSYDDARPGYLLGYLASTNPEYSGRPYHEVENDLRRGFTDEYEPEYDRLRDYARYGYERGAGLL
jgi:hypothetical protein